MIIYNRTLGHQTNSSSSHAIVFTNKKFKDSDVNGEFGGNDFICASDNAKLFYLKTIIGDHFDLDSFSTDVLKQIDQQIEKKLGQKLYNIFKGIGEPKDGYYCIVDHQSRFRLPFSRNKKISREFLMEFIDWLLQEHIYIFGGYDSRDCEWENYKNIETYCLSLDNMSLYFY